MKNFLFFLHLFIHLFIQLFMCTSKSHQFLFYCMDYNLLLTLFVAHTATDLATESHSGWLVCLFATSQSLFWTFPYFLTPFFAPVSSCNLPDPATELSIFPRSSFSFTGDQYLKIKTLLIGVLIFAGVSLLLDPFGVRAKKHISVCMNH